jgi:hypothetical protein
MRRTLLVVATVALVVASVSAAAPSVESAPVVDALTMLQMQAKGTTTHRQEETRAQRALYCVHTVCDARLMCARECVALRLVRPLACQTTRVRRV